ncbi:MAG: hypothetical protein WC871_02385 [Bacteroidales bacterium]|jgi:hypothetical protein
MRTTVFKVLGYEIKTPDGNFLEACIFWIYANSEKKAIEKAKKYKVNKKYYQVTEVIEKDENVTA